MVTDLGGASDIGGRRSIKSGIAGMGGAMSKSLSKMGMGKRQAVAQEAQAGDIPIDATGMEEPAIDMTSPDQAALAETMAAEAAISGEQSEQIPYVEPAIQPPASPNGIPGLTQGGANTVKGMQGMFGQSKNQSIVPGVKPLQDTANADPMRMIFGSNSPASQPAIIAGNAMTGKESTSLAPLQIVTGQNPVAAVPKTSKFDKHMAMDTLFGAKHNPTIEGEEVKTMKSSPIKIIASTGNPDRSMNSKESQKKALTGLFKGVETKE